MSNPNFIFLTPAEEKKLLSVVDNIRDKAIVKTFLDTGVFMSEFLSLTFEDIDLDNKILKVSINQTSEKEPSDRHCSRQIPLNQELVELLKQYYETRPHCEINQVFITNRGKPSPLSQRTVNKTLTKYQRQADLAKNISSVVLRNTFAVKLFSAGLAIEEISSVLGITNGETLSRYARVAKELQEDKSFSGKIEKLDQRTPLKKLADKISNIYSSPIEITKTINSKENKDAATVYIGRDNILADIRRDLARGQSVLVTGAYGLGKTALLKELVPDLQETDHTLKSILLRILNNKGVNVSSKESIVSLFQRFPKKEGGSPEIIPFDNFDKARKENIDLVESYLDNYTFLLTAENITSKLTRIKNKVNFYQLELLNDNNIETLIRARITQLAIPADKEKQLINHLKQTANGNPGAVNNMLNKLTRLPRITAVSIRDVYDDSGQKTRDWSGLIIVFFAAIVAMRYIARGAGDAELYVLSGVLGAVFILLKYFSGASRRKR